MLQMRALGCAKLLVLCTLHLAPCAVCLDHPNLDTPSRPYGSRAGFGVIILVDGRLSCGHFLARDDTDSGQARISLEVT